MGCNGAVVVMAVIKVGSHHIGSDSSQGWQALSSLCWWLYLVSSL